MTIHDPLTAVELPAHPDPVDLGASLVELGELLKAVGTRRLDLARQLAAVGYPSSTLGSGGGRSSDPTTSTERAAGLAGDIDTPARHNRWSLVDRILVNRLVALQRAAAELEAVVDLVGQHAPDNDPIPAGSGECEACGLVVRHNPIRKPGHRIKSGLCPADYQRWYRARETARAAGADVRVSDWTDRRRAELGLPARNQLGASA